MEISKKQPECISVSVSLCYIKKPIIIRSYINLYFIRSKIVKHTYNHEHVSSGLFSVSYILAACGFPTKTERWPRIENIISVLMSSISVKHDFAFLS